MSAVQSGLCFAPFVCPKPLQFHVRRHGVDSLLDSMSKSFPSDSLRDVRGRVLVVVEHIGSQDALEMPLEPVLELLRTRVPDCILIVDGAHTPGTRDRLPLDAGEACVPTSTGPISLCSL